MNTVVQMPIKPFVGILQCSACGAEANASCNCGAPYVPAGARAAAAVAENPEKSDRAIAAEIGVGSNTVRRAREEGGAPHGAPHPIRTGKDGKSYGTGLRDRVVEKIKEAGDKGMTSIELREAIDDVNPETVKSAVKTLASDGILSDSGKTRRGDNTKGKAPAVYVFNSDQKPRSHHKQRLPKADPKQHPMAANFKPSRKYPKLVRTNPRAVFPPECREELIKMLKPIIRSLYEQGKRVPGVTLLPGNIQSIASQLEKCLDEWCTAP